MRTRTQRLLPFLAATLLTTAQPAAGQIASLAFDLVGGHGSTTFSGGPQHLRALGERVVFTRFVSGLSFEHWVSDGTDLGTWLLADSCPGLCSAEPVLVSPNRVFWTAAADDSSGAPHRLWASDGTRAGTGPVTAAAVRPESGVVVVGERAFFVASDAQHGRELWVSDGTTSGTHVLRDIVPGSESSFPRGLGELAGGVLFVADDPVHDTALWKSDGTIGGTTLVRTMSPSNNVSQVFPIGNRALLALGEPVEDSQLWVTDGTAAGTQKLALPAPGGSGPLTYVHVLGDKAYFAYRAQGIGAELWESDGTLAGTRRITELPNDERFLDFLVDPTIAKAGERIVFLTLDDNFDRSLWATDGVIGHTTRLTSVCESCFGITITTKLFTVGGRAFLIQDDAQGDDGMWVTDGTPAGTHEIEEACPGICGGAQGPVVLGEHLYFLSGGPSRNTEIWRIDESAVPEPVTDLQAEDPFFSSPPTPRLDIVEAEGRLFFRAGDPRYGSELWVIDGQPGSEQLVAPAPHAGIASDPNHLAELGGRLFFAACDGSRRRMWVTNGAASGTRPLTPAEIFASCNPALLGPVTVAAGLGYFFTSAGLDGSLWRMDGTVAGTVQLADISRFGDGLSSMPMAALSGEVYYLQPGEEGVRLWRSNGAPAGTVPVVELPDTDLFGRSFLAPAEDLLYFRLRERDDAWNLWRTDGTAAGTVRLTDLAGRRAVLEVPPTSVAGRVYFFAEGTSDHFELWSTDGTPDGTTAIGDVATGFYFYGPSRPVAFDGKLYFFNGADDLGLALWRSDGTSAGTEEVQRFADYEITEPTDSFLTALDDHLYFVARSEGSGRELWRSDGTGTGTVMLKDIRPGLASSGLGSLTATGGRLFFTANDGVHGTELWVSDGTSQGTRLLHDLAPGPFSSDPAGLTQVGSRLYFSADDGVHGRELWSLDLTGDPTRCPPSEAGLCLQGDRFRVEIDWHTPQGLSGTGQPVELTSDTGYFWFFNPANVEAIVKVLDGRPVNDHFWTFYGALSNVEYTMTVTDSATGLTRRYFNPQGQLASVGDTESFGPNGASLESFTTPSELVYQSAEPDIASFLDRSQAGTCAPASNRLCLNGGRFAVEAAWRDFAGNTGTGTAVPLTADTGYFWFFRDSNVEVVLKVLDGRPVNGKFWVFYGALSNVEYTLTVTDTQTGAVKTYFNPAHRFASVADTGAF